MVFDRAELAKHEVKPHVRHAISLQRVQRVISGEVAAGLLWTWDDSESPEDDLN